MTSSGVDVQPIPALVPQSFSVHPSLGRTDPDNNCQSDGNSRLEETQARGTHASDKMQDHQGDGEEIPSSKHDKKYISNNKLNTTTEPTRASVPPLKIKIRPLCSVMAKVNPSGKESLESSPDEKSMYLKVSQAESAAPTIAHKRQHSSDSLSSVKNVVHHAESGKIQNSQLNFPNGGHKSEAHQNDGMHSEKSYGMGFYRPSPLRATDTPDRRNGQRDHQFPNSPKRAIINPFSPLKFDQRITENGQAKSIKPCSNPTEGGSEQALQTYSADKVKSPAGVSTTLASPGLGEGDFFIYKQYLSHHI